MFRALLTHLKEALQKRHLVYCVRVMSVGCFLINRIKMHHVGFTILKLLYCRL
jgi:hypothetical protein